MGNIITDKQVESLLSAGDPKKKTLSEALGHRGAGRLVAKKLGCGSVEFRFKYFRNRTQPVEMAIGRYQSKRSKTKVGITTAEARRQALLYSQQWQQGVDPKAYITEQLEKQRQEQQRIEVEARRGTFSQLLEVYVSTMKKEGKASWLQVQTDLERYVIKPFPALLKVNARDIEPEQITEVLAAMSKKGVTTSMNRVRSYLHTAFKVGCQAYLDPLLQAEQSIHFQLKHNPVSLIPRQAQYERVGNRSLSEAEIAAFWHAMNPYMGLHTELLFKLLFALGGQRPLHVLNTPWEAYDLDGKLVTINDTKNKTTHVVPLNSLAIEILQEVADFTGHCQYPFPKMRGAGYLVDQPMQVESLHKSVSRCLKGEGIKHFTPRDIRRTCKTLMGKAGISKETRDRIHNHALTDVSSRHYDRYDYLTEKREALNHWGDLLRAMVEPGSNVCLLRSRAS